MLHDLNNGIYYIHDTLNSIVYGTAMSKSGGGLECVDADTVKSFAISYSQPTGTYIYLAFNTGAGWFKLNSSGAAVVFTQNTPSYADLSEKGNTIPQLLALTSIPAFAKKSVRVIVGLAAEENASSFPQVKLSVNCSINEQTASKTEYSPVYELGDNATITNITYEGSASNGGSLSVKAQAMLQDGSSTGWQDISDIQGANALTLQLRALLNAPTIGSSSANISQAQITYFNSQYSAVEGKGEIISQTLDWHMNISQCRVCVKHSPLGDSTMKVYAAFRDSPKLILGEQLGVGSGSSKTFQLAHTNGIKYDTVKVYYDGVQIFSGWEFNGEVGRITCSAQSGVIVSCSYEYGWDSESWQQLSLSRSVALDGWDESEYRLDTDATGKSVCAIKIALATKSGSVTGEALGNGTGKAKTYKLKHKASGTPTILAAGSSLDRKNYTLLDDPQYIRIAAPSGKAITANYSWVSDTPRVFQFTAVFSA